MFTYRQNSRVIWEIGVGDHDGDVRFLTGSRNKAVLRMRNEKLAIWPIFMDGSPKFLHLIGHRSRRTRRWRQILTESRNKTVLRTRNEKYAIWPLVMAESPKLLHSSAMDLWTRLWGRYHVPQNVFLVFLMAFYKWYDLPCGLWWIAQVRVVCRICCEWFIV